MSHDFIYRTDAVDARAVVHRALVEQGFSVTTMPSGAYAAARGSVGRTLLLGALAGGSFRVSFIVEFFPKQDGTEVARLHRDMVSGALKGGAIGASRTKTAFEATANAIHAALAGDGLLIASAVS